MVDLVLTVFPVMPPELGKAGSQGVTGLEQVVFKKLMQIHFLCHY